MLSATQVRKIDPALKDLTDKELDDLAASLYETAQLAFDVWWMQREGSKYPVSSLPSSEIEGTV